MNLAIRGIEANFGQEPADSFHSDQYKDLKAVSSQLSESAPEAGPTTLHMSLSEPTGQSGARSSACTVRYPGAHRWCRSSCGPCSTRGAIRSLARSPMPMSTCVTDRAALRRCVRVTK